jgi:NADPH:quinone reductase-like Zn-dependent oxidoreductase
LRYFILPDTTMGSMAEQTVIDVRRSITVPGDSDPIAVAAGMNPAMSSWIALRQRVRFAAGQDVLILGATGNAGQLAVQVARRLGAGQVIAAGRDPARLTALPDLGATATVRLDGDAAARLGQVAGDVDVVLDYLWGQPAATAMAAIVTHRADRGQPLAWIQIGSMAGPEAPVPSAALRAARLQVIGSGQGSVPTRDILTELPALAREITAGTFDISARPVPLADVEQAWADTARTPHRVVLTP